MKTTIVAASLLINCAAAVWTFQLIGNGRILGESAIVSLDDAYVAFALVALSFVANLILAVTLLRRRESATTPTAPARHEPPREWDYPCPTCGAAISRTMRHCTMCGARDASAPPHPRDI